MDSATNEVVDLLILVDATSSMSSYLESLKQSLPQIISIAALTNCFERIGLLAYRDYCDKDLLEWSGWMTVDGHDQPDLVNIAGKLRATGGGDYPEATKTGLAKAYSVMRADAKTLILLYADAPPHMAGEDTGYSNYTQEQEALDAESYGGYGSCFADWVSGAGFLRHGAKKSQVMCVMHGGYDLGCYRYLSAMTNGACFFLQNQRPRSISEVTIEILLAWMGVKKQFTDSVALPAKWSSYTDESGILQCQNETDYRAWKYLKESDLGGVALSTKLLEQKLPKKDTPLQDFSQTYKESGAYRGVVTSHLRRIVERDVTAISLNPVFGSLWRTFCNDRENDSRQELLDLFGRKVDSITSAEERAKMKVWLEESYDYTAEVQEYISAVPESLRYPCVCLDPTLVFVRSVADQAEDGEQDEEESRAITSFRRDELLELGRSCDWRILRRLGKVLTRLTFVDSADQMPAHIASADEAETPRIPMALASRQYGRKLWRILLHIVVPGTMLSGRAGALLAALTIKLGVKPLQQAAETELLLWRNKWNDLEVPETWNVSCMSLLLDADKTYREGRRTNLETLTLKDDAGLLLDEDRALFQRLVEYRMLESNLNTTLKARVSWHPQKTLLPVGALITCKDCDFPRSVTMMGPNGICGLCCFYREANETNDHVDLRVSAQDTKDTPAYWFECNVQQCRAQYIVYWVEGLNVRPKCHYCRNHAKAPMVECSKCLSRVIWPEEYRPKDLTDFVCVGCESGQETQVVVETTATQLREENGTTWLLENKDGKLKNPFTGGSMFKLASAAQPLNEFCDKVHILPNRTSTDLQLHLHGKPIRNSQSLVEDLYSWVFRRRTESGTCSLCFSNAKKNLLLPACGRSGCRQQVCHGCSQGWYGLNAPGQIINTAALHCPFCRRAPTPKTLARFGMGVHALGNLKDAVAQSGEWIFAWCADCGHAKQYMERVCAAGAPDELSGWKCDECRAAKGEQKKIRPCPGCGVQTEKTGGCDHIQCTCGTHWCFFCGKEQTEDGVYGHMRDEHGGYYGGREEDEEEGEDYDD